MGDIPLGGRRFLYSQEWTIRVREELFQGGDHIWIGSWGFYLWKQSELRDGLRKVADRWASAEMIIGYGDARGLTNIIATINEFPAVTVRVLYDFHAKYFITQRGTRYFGTLGSHNFGDSSFTNISLKLTAEEAKVLMRFHKTRWPIAKPYKEELQRIKDNEANLINKTYLSPNSVE